MIRGAVDTSGDVDPAGLRDAYDDLLITALKTTGIDAAAEQTGVDEETLAALVDGESPELTLEEAAAVLALDEDFPAADAIVAEARDILLMGMSQAVLDVEALASGIDDAMDPKELQQKVEGRYPMTLEEYALVHAYIENRKR
jgi:hypothetical protein